MGSPQEALWAHNLERLRLSLVAQADRIRTGSRHATIKGASLEVVLRRTLTDYMPGYFRIGSGQVVNNQHDVSPQLDAIVYDQSAFPHLAVNEDSSVLICCEALLAAIECKTAWNSPDVLAHFTRFTQVEAKRHKHFADPSNAAGYFVVVFDAMTLDSSSESALRDANRSIGVYTVRGNKAWSSPYGDSSFAEQTESALSCFLRDVLLDCMRKGQKELGTFTTAYEVLETYFGRSPNPPMQPTGCAGS